MFRNGSVRLWAAGLEASPRRCHPCGFAITILYSCKPWCQQLRRQAWHKLASTACQRQILDRLCGDKFEHALSLTAGLGHKLLRNPLSGEVSFSRLTRRPAPLGPDVYFPTEGERKGFLEATPTPEGERLRHQLDRSGEPSRLSSSPNKQTDSRFRRAHHYIRQGP